MSGLTVRELMDLLGDADPDALAVTGWSRDGRNRPAEGIDVGWYTPDDVGWFRPYVNDVDYPRPGEVKAVTIS